MSSTASTLSPRSSIWGGTVAGSAIAGANGMVNVNRLPSPTVLVDLQVAAHDLGELAADRQPEARAAEAPRRRGVGLLEGLEEPREVLLGDADAGVGDR